MSDTTVHVPDLLQDVKEGGTIQLVDVDELTLHPENPREGNVEAIKESIEENGFFSVLLVQKSTGYVVIGNHRLKAARQLGLEQVPALTAPMDDDTALRILLADNRTGDEALWSYEDLAQLLVDMQETTDRGLDGTGYDEEQIAGMRQVYLSGSDDGGSSTSTSDDGGDEEEDEPSGSSASEQWLGDGEMGMDKTGKKIEIHVQFENEEDRERFVEEHDLEGHLTVRRDRVWSMRWPEEGRRDLSSVKLEPDDDA